MDNLNKNETHYVTSTAEEDLLVAAGSPASPNMTIARWLGLIMLSVLVLSVYFTINHVLFPAYPVLNTFAENDENYASNYPPFRLNEYGFYELTGSLIYGGSSSILNLQGRPVGYALLAVPLTVKFGDIGMYYTNAVIMWAAMLVFFLVMVQLTRFGVALAATAILALATPNLFFAASAYGETLSQLLLLLSVLFFVRGLSSYKEAHHYALCGFTLGLQLFAQPCLLITAIVFITVIFAERSFKTWKDSGIFSLIGGILAAVIVYLLIYRIVIGRFPGGFFTISWWMPWNLYHTGSGSCNPVTAFWRYLFNSPQGLLFIMPAVMLTPLGIILMWRDMYRAHAIVVGALFLIVIGMASIFCGYGTGESIGGRLLLPVIPFAIMPLAFVWEQEIGEKIWLAITLVFTVYMSSFGWWMGPVGKKDMFGNLFQDRDARTIMLARKGFVERPVFKSRSEIVAQFTASLQERNLRKWIETLSPVTIAAINGFERIVFTAISDHIINGDVKADEYIDSVDPDNGILLVLPEIGRWGDSLFLPVQPE